MVLKLKEDKSYVFNTDKQKGNEKDHRKHFSQVEALYVALIYFATHCLSCVSLEAGSRVPHGNPVTKSAAFNALFRRAYNLRIVILVTNVIAGVITTLMMALGDRYKIPYLYLPWLVNTMKEMALCEGPTLLNLASVLLPNITIPTATFMFITFLLYVEELCIWNIVFKNFQHCWKDYHNQKQSTMEKAKEELFAARNKTFICQGDIKNELNIRVEKLRNEQKPIKFYNNINDGLSTDIRMRPAKSTIGDNSNFSRNQLPDITG